jgi:hypothetical protein
MNVVYVDYHKAIELHSKGCLMAETCNIPEVYTDQTFLDVCTDIEKYNPLKTLYVEFTTLIYQDGSVKGLKANLYQEE